MKKICIMLMLCALLLPLAAGLAEGETTLFGWQGDVRFFSEGGKIGLMDRQGQTLYPPALDGGGLFTPGGLAEVVQDGKSGAINKAGELVIPFAEGRFFLPYSDFADAQTGLMIFSHPDQTMTIYTPAGEKLGGQRWLNVLPFVGGSAPVQGDEGWNLLSLDGKLLCPIWYEDVEQNPDAGGGIFSRDGKEFGLDAEGNLLYTRDETGVVAWKNGAEGEMATRPEDWKNVSLLSDDRIMYQKDGLWGLGSRDGKALTPPVWEYFLYWEEEGKTMPIAVYSEDGQMGLMTLEGELLLQPQYGRIEILSENAFVIWDGEDGIAPRKTVDAAGNLIQQLPEGSWHNSLSIGAEYQHYSCTGKEPNSGWYLLSRDGTIALQGDQGELEYHGVFLNDKGLFIALRDQDGLFYQTPDGTRLADPEWDQPLFADAHYLITARKDGSACYTGLKGQPDLVLPAEFVPGSSLLVDGQYYIHVAQLVEGKIYHSYVNAEGQLLYPLR